MTIRRCTKSVGGFMSENGTDELLVMTQHKCYENGTFTVNMQIYFHKQRANNCYLVFSYKYNIQLTSSTSKPNK